LANCAASNDLAFTQHANADDGGEDFYGVGGEHGLQCFGRAELGFWNGDAVHAIRSCGPQGWFG